MAEFGRQMFSRIARLPKCVALAAGAACWTSIKPSISARYVNRFCRTMDVDPSFGRIAPPEVLGTMLREPSTAAGTLASTREPAPTYDHDQPIGPIRESTHRDGPPRRWTVGRQPTPTTNLAHDRGIARIVVEQDSLLSRLQALANNVWWTWQPDVGSLFRELDPRRWRQLDHNPIALLSEFTLERLEQRAGEVVLHDRINCAHRRLQEYLRATNTWGKTHAGVLGARPVAYFSAEFGLHESLPIYSGGLGVLAGDHLKSASDLGVPMIGIGLLYDQGYFLQRLGPNDWQQEEYINVDVERLPIMPALAPDGRQITIQVETQHGGIRARIWKVAVGRTLLLLLDSDVEGNRMEDRELTARLYGGDHRVRIRQELLLGVGGVRALQALRIFPGVVHLNEGHSAFAGLEMVRQRMQNDGLTYQDAVGQVASMTTFTTHTPVAAGHDRFAANLIDEHLGPLGHELGLSHEQLMGLGRVDPDNLSESFCMTVLALKLSRRANAVSSLHGHVSRQMWTSLWPNRPEEHVPIGHITNGVHVHSWLAPQMHRLYDRHFGRDWERHSGEPEVWSRIDQVDDGELWETHQALKARLIDFVGRRAAQSASTSRAPAPQLRTDVLTIGFARRFATYKRATLIMQDFERLLRLLHDTNRPIQLIVAGKAHPNDEAGKKVLWQVASAARDPRYGGRIAFVEDYDINVGRHLVQGVDVWLNNPRRPLEASGTSGQKAVLNGGLNLSILDGWWAEAFDGANGFAIGSGHTHASVEVQDQRDADALYETLEREVIPLYYDVDQADLPIAWIRRVKHAIRTLGWRFNADRMVMDYVANCYLPAAGGLSCHMP